MFGDLLSWFLVLMLVVAFIEYGRWLFSSPTREETTECGEGMKEACRYDLRKFCEYYLEETFYNEFTRDQAKAIAGLQSSILFGGEYLQPIERGLGCTSIIKAAAIWAAAYRHRSFIVVLCRQASHAQMMHHQVDDELWKNERLWDDFPRKTRWPSIAFLSITESLKGVIETNEAGQRIRPDCVLADSIDSGNFSLCENERRRRAFDRFVGSLHFQQPGTTPLAIGRLWGFESLRQIIDRVAAKSLSEGLRKVHKSLTELHEFETRTRTSTGKAKAGRAFVELDPQGEPPAAPQEQTGCEGTTRNEAAARDAVERLRSQKTDSA